MLGVVLIKTVQDRDAHQVTQDVARAARKVAGVSDSFSVLGRYDNVVFIEGKDFATLRKIAARVAALDGVKTSETLCESE